MNTTLRNVTPAQPLVLVGRDTKPDVATVRRMVLDRGHQWFSNGRQLYNLNIVGIRVADARWDHFDDWLMVAWPKVDNAGASATDYGTFVAKITTLPGDYYMTKKLLNPMGCAILKGGQWRRAYKIRKHRGKYDALCQDLAPVEFYRDGNRDKDWDLDPESVRSGYIGLNIHDSPDDAVTLRIGLWSAACQVFSDDRDFDAFMRLCFRARAAWGNEFTYTLIDLLAESRLRGF